MSTYRILKSATCVSILVSLSACMSSNTANGPGGSLGFEAAFDAATDLAPTTDMPTSLNATYTGQMKVGVNSGSTPLFGTIDAQNAEIIGDVTLDVDWTDGMTGPALTGNATNFVATEAGTTNSVDLGGTLEVATTPTPTVSRVSMPATVIAGQTIPALNTGAFQATLSGQLSNGSDAGDVTLLLGGTFFGSGARAMTGPVSGGVRATDSTNPGLFDAGFGGTFYANRK